MKKTITSILILTLIIGGFSLGFASKSSEKTCEVKNEKLIAKYNLPVNLTAKDFITKIYGLVSPDSANSIVERVTALTGIEPVEDEFGLWLGNENGYMVNYYGQKPDIEAMAIFNNGKIDNYGFFFIFPYKAGKRYDSMIRQVVFVSTLLQEMKDLGMIMNSDGDTDGIFETEGNYDGKYVSLKLVEEIESDNNSGFMNVGMEYVDNMDHSPEKDGRFILAMKVEP